MIIIIDQTTRVDIKHYFFPLNSNQTKKKSISHIIRRPMKDIL